ncbi:hypothetical protein M0R45_031645 [Rubus argutus]|uniref:PPIase cyclophilin-type domain-containing protein n=1 Tax=Rubus argutus TaxID=59490 RepID=A0AAW1WGS7_RUBAR
MNQEIFGLKLFDDKVPRTAKNFRQLREGTVEGLRANTSNTKIQHFIGSSKALEPKVVIFHEEMAPVESAITHNLPHLDGRNVVFGKVSDGMEVLDKIEQVETDVIGKPMKTVKIVNCGVKEDDSYLRPSITPGQGTSRKARMRRKNKQLAGGEPQVR